MSTPAPHGATAPARTGYNLRDEQSPKLTQQKPSCPDVETAVALGLTRRKAKQLVSYWQAQARAEVGFRDWILTYLDPTGEHATDNVLRQYAKELAA